MILANIVSLLDRDKKNNIEIRDQNGKHLHRVHSTERHIPSYYADNQVLNIFAEDNWLIIQIAYTG